MASRWDSHNIAFGESPVIASYYDRCRRLFHTSTPAVFAREKQRAKRWYIVLLHMVRDGALDAARKYILAGLPAGLQPRGALLLVRWAENAPTKGRPPAMRGLTPLQIIQPNDDIQLMHSHRACPFLHIGADDPAEVLTKFEKLRPDLLWADNVTPLWR